MKKILFGIFICLGFVFAMSYNANALTSTFNINNYDIVRSDYRLGINCIGNFNAILNSYTCDIPYVTSGLTNITNIYTNQITAKAGDIIEYYLVFSNSLNNSIDGGSLSFNIYQPQNASNIQTLSIENVDTNIFLEIGSSYTQNPEFFNSIDGFTVYNKNKISKVYKITQRVINDGSHRFGLAGSSDLPLLSFYNVSGNSVITANLALFTQYRYVGSAEDEAAKKELESTDNIENQTPPSSNETGDGAQATNLIGAFSGFVTALGSLSATNCNLTLNFPDFAGGSRVVNVCQNKDKAGNIISVFSSLTLIIFYVPLAIRLLTMIYNEIRSFTNG